MLTVLFYLTRHYKIIIYSSLLFVLVFLGSCHNTTQHRQWNSAVIDPMIAINGVYKLLDKEKEVFSVFEKQDPTAKRSSGVLYFTKGHVNLLDSSSARLNNCRAYFLNDDMLSITLELEMALVAGASSLTTEIRNFMQNRIIPPTLLFRMNRNLYLT